MNQHQTGVQLSYRTIKSFIESENRKYVYDMHLLSEESNIINSSKDGEDIVERHLGFSGIASCSRACDALYNEHRSLDQVN